MGHAANYDDDKRIACNGTHRNAYLLQEVIAMHKLHYLHDYLLMHLPSLDPLLLSLCRGSLLVSEGKKKGRQGYVIVVALRQKVVFFLQLNSHFDISPTLPLSCSIL